MKIWSILFVILAMCFSVEVTLTAYYLLQTGHCPDYTGFDLAAAIGVFITGFMAIKK